MPISIDNNGIKLLCVHNEELFDFIHQVNLSIGHGNRTIVDHGVNTNDKRITY